jgi:hypothetical protein
MANITVRSNPRGTWSTARDQSPLDALAAVTGNTLEGKDGGRHTGIVLAS